jgi:hypothetical protein
MEGRSANIQLRADNRVNWKMLGAALAAIAYQRIGLRIENVQLEPHLGCWRYWRTNGPLA